MRVAPSGELLLGKTVAEGVGLIQIKTNPTVNWGVGVQHSVDTAGGVFFGMMNAANQIQGAIQSVAGATSVVYNTTSDQRLKDDLGIAEDLTALRAVVVHDFTWQVHGGHDRGVFAQETFPVFPRAISVGSPGNDLSKPWMTDYSKFVPDLIVGWQQHEARLAVLEAQLKGS